MVHFIKINQIHSFNLQFDAKTLYSCRNELKLISILSQTYRLIN